MMRYVNTNVSCVQRHCRKPIVVFNGYLSGSSTNTVDATQQRRAGMRVGLTVQVAKTAATPLKLPCHH